MWQASVKFETMHTCTKTYFNLHGDIHFDDEKNIFFLSLAIQIIKKKNAMVCKSCVVVVKPKALI